MAKTLYYGGPILTMKAENDYVEMSKDFTTERALPHWSLRTLHWLWWPRASRSMWLRGR